MNKLEGKIALITGGNSGIGLCDVGQIGIELPLGRTLAHCHNSLSS